MVRNLVKEDRVIFENSQRKARERSEHFQEASSDDYKKERRSSRVKLVFQKSGPKETRQSLKTIHSTTSHRALP